MSVVYVENDFRIVLSRFCDEVYCLLLVFIINKRIILLFVVVVVKLCVFVNVKGVFS